MLRYRSTSRRVFEVINIGLFTLFIVMIVLPFLNVIAISLSGYQAVSHSRVTIYPVDFSLDGYRTIVTNLYFLRAMGNSVLLTVVNTTLVIVIALLAGYALANKHFVGRRVVFMIFLVPMYFSGGLIPTYILIANWLHLVNNRLAMILPVVTNVFYIIVFRNTITQLPQEIMDSGEIDGANDYTILFRLVFPVMLPMVTAFTIFSAVAYWNEWFGSLLYMQDINKWTLQFRLRDILINANLRDDPTNPIRARVDPNSVHPQILRMAALIVTIVPIALVYPFLQRYFIHGIIVGAVKG
jgi:putative aldouronate transport system permease protein